MRLREGKNLPKVTQLVIKTWAAPTYSAIAPSIPEDQTPSISKWNVLPPPRAREIILGSFGRWAEAGGTQSLFAIIAFILFSSLLLPAPPPTENSLLKYLRTVRCLQAPWSLQREDLIQIQLNKFHLKWEDPTLGQKASHEAYSSSTTASRQYLSNHRILKYSTFSIKNAWNNKAKWLCASG